MVYPGTEKLGLYRSLKGLYLHLYGHRKPRLAGLDDEDILQEIVVFYLRMQQTNPWNPTRGAWTTYAAYAIRSAVHTLSRGISRKPVMNELPMHLDGTVETETWKAGYQAFRSLQGKKDRIVLAGLYAGLTHKEIAPKLGVTRQAVSLRVEKLRGACHDWLEG